MKDSGQGIRLDQGDFPARWHLRAVLVTAALVAVVCALAFKLVLG